MNRWRLARTEAHRRPWSLAAVALLAALGASLAVLGGGAILWLEQVADHLGMTGDDEELVLRVRPSNPSGGTGFSTERAMISDDQLAQMRDLPGVSSVRATRQIPLPAMVGIYVPGIMDAVQTVSLVTVDSDSLTLTEGAEWTDRPGRIPMAINPEVLTLFNLGFADRYGMPRLDPDLLLERTFDLIVGRDEFVQVQGHFDTRIRVVATSRDFPPWSIAVPPATGQRYIDHFEGSLRGPAGITAAVLVCSTPATLESAAQAVEAMELTVADDTRLAAAVGDAISILEIAVSVLVLIILVVAGIAAAAVVSAIASERRRQIGLWLTFGARASDLLVILAGGLACYATLAACLAAAGAVLGLDPLIDLIARATDQEALAIPIAQALWWWVPVVGVTAGGITILATIPGILQARRGARLALMRS